MFQLIKPTLDNILRGVSTSIFEAWKENLEVAVKGGQDLDSAAADCTKWFINEFWKRLEGYIAPNSSKVHYYIVLG